MNHGVPQFHQTEDYYGDNHLSGFSTNTRPAATLAMTGNQREFTEMFWQNGNPVFQKPSNINITPTPLAGGSGSIDAITLAELPAIKESHAAGVQEKHQIFMQQDEMGSWLQYPIDNAASVNYADLFSSAPPPIAPTTTATLAEIHPEYIPLPAQDPPQVMNFENFSRIVPSDNPSIDSMSTPPLLTIAGNYTVGESSQPPLPPLPPPTNDLLPPTNGQLADVTCNLSGTSSPGGSETSFSSSGDTLLATPKQDLPPPPPTVVDRKGKGIETDHNECCRIKFKAMEIGGTEGRRHGRSASTSTTKRSRSRASEVHNQSERRHPDRINEKLKTLQDLIPGSKKSDKASMLDDAIEYVKYMQRQVQMMSMGYSMVPVMYPGMQQYMVGTGMGMGTGMDTSMTRPMVPFPAMLPVPGSAMPNTAAASNMGPRFPNPGFLQPHDPSSTQPSSSHQVPMINSLPAHTANRPSVQNFVNPYQQVLGLHQTQLALPQNQAMGQHDAEASTSKEVGNTETK